MPSSKFRSAQPATLVAVFATILVMIPAAALFGKDLLDARRDGSRFARYRTQAQCVNEVTRGHHVCLGTGCFLRNRMFFQACMDRARPTDSLCEAIPPFSSLLQLEMWKREQCEALGRVDRTCYHIWLRVLQACDGE